jgi:uncharacterized membrane protein YgcG
MGRSWTRLLLPAALAGCWLGLAGPAGAVFPPPVRDDGKFFSKEALEKANKKIREIYEKYKKDVVVETLASLTPEQEKKLKDEDKNKFFARLARDRSVELGLNGVYIVFSKKPPHYQIHMDPQTQKTVFKVSDRKAVAGKIVAQFREENFDQGLLDGLDAIEAALKANSK